MSTKITIGSTVINFPTSGTDPNWAEAVDEFALAVESELAGINLTYDVSPRVVAIPETGTLNLGGANLLQFPNASVRSFVVTYSIYKRTTSPTQTFSESGTFTAVNENGVWTFQREFFGDKQSDGTSYHQFSMNQDSVEVTSYALPGGGTYDSTNSKISYSAKTLPITI